MPNKIEKTYIPYEGNEPYLFLRFAEKDSDRVAPVLDYLYSHKCRVWYFSDNARDMEESERRQKRMNNAYLTLLFLTENAVNDSKLKSDILYTAAQGKNYLVLRQDDISNLAMGLNEDAPSVNNVDDIIRAEGFTMKLIGEDIRVNIKEKKGKQLMVSLIVLAVAAAICIAAFLTSKKEQVLNSEEVKTLYLETIPDDISELDIYPNLEKIVIPQSEALRTDKLPDRYEIVITN